MGQVLPGASRAETPEKKAATGMKPETQLLVDKLRALAARTSSQGLFDLAMAFSDCLQVMRDQSRLIAELQDQIRQLKGSAL
jgi:hypothetical protein